MEIKINDTYNRTLNDNQALNTTLQSEFYPRSHVDTEIESVHDLFNSTMDAKVTALVDTQITGRNLTFLSEQFSEQIDDRFMNYDEQLDSKATKKDIQEMNTNVTNKVASTNYNLANLTNSHNSLFYMVVVMILGLGGGFLYIFKFKPKQFGNLLTVKSDNVQPKGSSDSLLMAEDYINQIKTLRELKLNIINMKIDKHMKEKLIEDVDNEVIKTQEDLNQQVNYYQSMSKFKKEDGDKVRKKKKGKEPTGQKINHNIRT